MEADLLEQRDDEVEVDDALVHRLERHTRFRTDAERVGEAAVLVVRVAEAGIEQVALVRRQGLGPDVGRVRIRREKVPRHLDRVLEPERLHGECSARHSEHLAAAEVAAEALGVDRRAHEDQAEVGPVDEDVAQGEEQEVAVELALVLSCQR